jgi:hypothetical protein
MFRSQDEVSESFARAAAELDGALKRFLETPMAQSVEIDDRSNRSGFDMSGFGQPAWTFVIRKQWERGSLIVKNEAMVSYREPIEVEKGPEVVAQWVAEAFPRGAGWSAFKDKGEVVVSLGHLAGDGLGSVLSLLLAEAEEKTPPELAPE